MLSKPEVSQIRSNLFVVKCEVSCLTALVQSIIVLTMIAPLFLFLVLCSARNPMISWPSSVLLAVIIIKLLEMLQDSFFHFETLIHLMDCQGYRDTAYWLSNPCTLLDILRDHGRFLVDSKHLLASSWILDIVLRFLRFCGI